MMVAQAPGLQQLLLVLLQMQGDSGSTLRLFEGLQGVGAAPVGLPPYPVLRGQPGAA